MTLHIDIQTIYKHDQFSKQPEKTTKRVQFFVDFFTVKSHFFNNGPLKCVIVFLHLNQSIKTLLLSFQTSPSDHFHFSPLQGDTRAVFEKQVPTCLKLVEIQKQKYFRKQQRKMKAMIP